MITEVCMNKFIITISREFGSGGRLIGERLASRLGIEYYNKSIIQTAAESVGLPDKSIEQQKERITESLLSNSPAEASRSGYDAAAFFDTPVNDGTFLEQTDIIRAFAKTSCVIVGRCADHILRDYPELIKVFITADFNDRVRRAVEDYGFPSEEAEEKIKKIDKSRANYYRYYTDQAWGNLHNYHLVVNSSFSGISGAVAIIMTLLEEKGISTKSF